MVMSPQSKGKYSLFHKICKRSYSADTFNIKYSIYYLVWGYQYCPGILNI